MITCDICVFIYLNIIYTVNCYINSSSGLDPDNVIESGTQTINVTGKRSSGVVQV